MLAEVRIHVAIVHELRKRFMLVAIVLQGVCAVLIRLPYRSSGKGRRSVRAAGGMLREEELSFNHSFARAENLSRAGAPAEDNRNIKERFVCRRWPLRFNVRRNFYRPAAVICELRRARVTMGGYCLRTASPKAT